MSMNARTSVALTCASATRRSLSMGHFSPSTAAAAAWRFEVAAVYAPGIIIISSWVPGVLEAKSWGTRISLGTTVGDAACRSMLLFVVLLLMWFSCCAASTHRASASNNKQQCCCLSTSYRWQRWHCGKICRSRGCPPCFGGACLLWPPFVASAACCVA